jgi:hypothetical protein
VVVVSEDSLAPPPSENRDAVTLLASEPVQAEATTSLLPAVEVPVPSPAVEVSGHSPTTEVAESSSGRVVLTAEEMMKLATCRYIDFPGVGVIDLEAPQLPKKVYEVAAERMFNEPTIMETIASVLKALQEYERADGFAPATGAEKAPRRIQLSWRSQLVMSWSVMRPCLYRRVRVERSSSQDQRKLSKPEPPPPSRRWQRPLSRR